MERPILNLAPPPSPPPPSLPPGLPPSSDPPPSPTPDHPNDAADADALALAAALFAGREYRRAAHVLSSATGPRCTFLAAFSLYLAGEATRATARLERGAALGGGGGAGVTAPATPGTAGGGPGGGATAASPGLPTPTAGAGADPGNAELSAVLARLQAGARGPPSPSWDPFALYLVGLVRADAGDAPGAVDALAASLRAFPLNWGAWTALAGLAGAATAAAASPGAAAGAGGVGASLADAVGDPRLPRHWAVHVSFCFVFADGEGGSARAHGGLLSSIPHLTHLPLSFFLPHPPRSSTPPTWPTSPTTRPPPWPP